MPINKAWLTVQEKSREIFMVNSLVSCPARLACAENGDNGILCEQEGSRRSGQAGASGWIDRGSTMNHAWKHVLPRQARSPEDSGAELMPAVQADRIDEESRDAERETPATHEHMQDLYRLIPLQVSLRHGR